MSHEKDLKQQRLLINDVKKLNKLHVRKIFIIWLHLNIRKIIFSHNALGKTLNKHIEVSSKKKIIELV